MVDDSLNKMIHSSERYWQSKSYRLSISFCLVKVVAAVSQLAIRNIFKGQVTVLEVPKYAREAMSWHASFPLSVSRGFLKLR
jgi:hypothetical protein